MANVKLSSLVLFRNAGKLVALLLLGGIMPGARAATEITFTGGDAANPTNLSSSANWSAAPGAETIGVINLSSTPAQGYVVNSDLSLSGLRIINNASKPVTIGGVGTLTIGADGYVSGAKGNLTLNCPLATSASQVWEFKQADFTTSSTISGSGEMVISNYTYCVHSATVNYGGTPQRIDGCRIAALASGRRTLSRLQGLSNCITQGQGMSAAATSSRQAALGKATAGRNTFP